MGTPAADGVAAEALSLTTDDGVSLAGWFMPSPAPRSERRAVVLVHGLDSHGWAGYHRDAARAYLAAGFDVVVFDLRAQGKSGGERIGLGWQERLDVRAVVDELLRRGLQPGSIGIHGSSYGGGTSVMAAASIPEIGAVLVDCPWADIRLLLADELERKTGFGALFVPGVVRLGMWKHGMDLDAHEPVLLAPKLAPRPLLVVVGEADSRIPPQHSTLLFDAAQEPKEIWRMPGVEHTDGWNREPEAYRARAVAFFDRSLRGAP